MVGLPLKVALDVVDGLPPGVKLLVGLVVGEADSVAVEEVLGDSPTEIEGVGVCVGLPVSVPLAVDEGLAPTVKLGVGD